MAGLKKPSKRDKSNPNTVLVIFLVFFVLLSIGLGVWGYYGYADRDKLTEAAKTAKKDAGAFNERAEFFATLARDARAALGETLDPDDQVKYAASIADILAEGGQFKAQDPKDREL